MLRKIVAGPKVRTIQNGYDLDLTYVTDRIVAMAFPAEGFQKLYRNSIDDVANFIKQKHQGNFMIFNLSGRKYTYEKFDGKVKQYDWEDHQAPALYTIFEICQQIINYLEQNEKNIVIVHCNHGKGRTGTIIVSFLLFANFYDNVEEALQFYAKRRFEKQGYGVTQPCQVRYIRYFHQLLIHKDVKIKAFALKMIRFTGTFDIGDCHCQLSHARSKKSIITTNTLQGAILGVKTKKLLLGDIFFDFKIPGMLGLGEKQLARLNINTIFMPANRIISLKGFEISPDNLLSKHKGLVGKDFGMDIVFEDFCDCNMVEQTQGKCQCAQELEMEKMYWEKIYLILKIYERPTKEMSVKLLFGSDVHKSKQDKEKGEKEKKKKKKEKEKQKEKQKQKQKEQQKQKQKQHSIDNEKKQQKQAKQKHLSNTQETYEQNNQKAMKQF